MTSTKGLLLAAVGRLVLRPAAVIDVRAITPRLRRVELHGDALRDVAWTAGDKVQVLLPERDVRTYTPLSWDPGAGRTALLIYDHGEAPGARWSRRVAVGESCRFIGPQRSLSRGPGRSAIVFGDETSLAVAHAFRRAQPRAPLVGIFEVGEGEGLDAALDLLGLGGATVVQRRDGDAHLGVVAAHLRDARRRHPDAEVFFTGRAQSIQVLRRQLRELGATRGVSKAYWSVGKTGLD